MQNEVSEKKYLLQALELAVIKQGFCAPNPSVGAVIISQTGIVLSTGRHLGPGTPHAETDAINKWMQSYCGFTEGIHSQTMNADILTKIQQELSTATIYITLEPCCHYGRTPPCTEAIIKSGIKKVVYGYRDPNPLVSGKGESLLHDAGILCEHIPQKEIDEFYKAYQYWHATQKPFITAKIAMTLDGKIAGKNSEPIKITGYEINQYTHKQRRLHDAILTTSQTIIADDPQMNVRIDHGVPNQLSEESGERQIKKKLYVLDSQLRLPLNAKVFKTTQSIIVFHGKNVSEKKLTQLKDQQVHCVEVNENHQGLNLDQVIQWIGHDGIHSLWIEAGGKCFSSFVEKQLLQRAFIYIAPRYLGEGKSAFATDIQLDFVKENIRWKQMGSDALCEIIFSPIPEKIEPST